MGARVERGQWEQVWNLGSRLSSTGESAASWGVTATGPSISCPALVSGIPLRDGIKEGRCSPGAGSGIG